MFGSRCRRMREKTMFGSRQQRTTSANDRTHLSSFRSLAAAYFPHPYLSCVAAAFALLNLAEGLYILHAAGITAMGLGLFGLRTAMAVWFAARPRHGAYGLLALLAIEMFVPVSTPFTSYLLALAAIATISYFRSAAGVGCGAAFAPCAIAYGVIAPYGVMGQGGAMTFAGLDVAAICIGICVRSAARDSLNEHERHVRQRNVRIARDLHDHATNDITDMMMLIDWYRSSPDTVSAAELEALRAIADDALRHTRQAIATLEEEAQDPRSTLGMTVTSQQQLSDDIARHRARLQRMGYAGDVIITGDIDVLNDSDALFVADFLRELFGNIARYADPAQRYVMLVSANQDCVTIDVTDRPRQGGATLEGRHSGLAYYRERVLHAHGDWDVREEHGQWVLHVSVPIDNAGSSITPVIR